MLTELKRLHAAILAGLDELDRLTALPQPPMDRLPGVRLTLTRASRARTMLLERTFAELVKRAPPGQRSALEALRAKGKDNLVNSARHIGTWTLCEIAGSWPEYCAASRVMRATMRQAVKEEAALIYPLLANVGATASAA